VRVALRTDLSKNLAVLHHSRVFIASS